MITKNQLLDVLLAILQPAPVPKRAPEMGPAFFVLLLRLYYARPPG